MIMFRPLPSNPKYIVGDDGTVIGAFGRPLKPIVRHPNGYLVVSVYAGQRARQRYVHHLVLETFVGPRPPGQECRHLNGDRTDNRLCNLRWGTHSENQFDQVAHGTHPLAGNPTCRRGHAFTPENTISRLTRKGRPRRQCRQCCNDRARESRRILKLERQLNGPWCSESGCIRGAEYRLRTQEPLCSPCYQRVSRYKKSGDCA
ncbi:HNH endonuclease signature motif containing protein [Mycobacterium intracellulare]|uniref:HNH endonuclease signature motif containing protein n=1 Tax=Mycobacterium intracellulare TaxID=1767 RepID=UPI003BF82DAA